MPIEGRDALDLYVRGIGDNLRAIEAQLGKLGAAIAALSANLGKPDEPFASGDGVAAGPSDSKYDTRPRR